MAEITRKSRIAFKEEVTEGTPVLPTAATDFMALQDGFEFGPETEFQDNEELKASIGKAKGIVGIERGNASFSHYLRHSGVEGQAPNFGKLWKSLLGSETVNATQYNTVAASTVSVIKVDAGEGATFALGEALLIKDGVNGYSVRPVESVATDDLTLAFNVAVAPAVGVDLGKAVIYKPLEGSEPTLTGTMYRGNGGALEVISGLRVTEASIEMTAGELINCSYTLGGVKYYFDPIEITATSKYIDFVLTSGTYAAQLTEKLYRDPHELAEEIQNKMDALAVGGEAITCVYNDVGTNKGKFTITASGSATFSLLWLTGTNTANSAKTKLGHNNTDDTGALFYISDNVQGWASVLTPTYDSADPRAAKAVEVLLGDADDLVNPCLQEATITVTSERQEIPCAGSVTGIDGSIVSAREVTAELTATLDRHDADKFKRYRKNDSLKLLINFGDKLGANWIPGTVCSIFMARAVIQEFSVGDADGIVTLQLSLQGFVDNAGSSEFFLNFL